MYKKRTKRLIVFDARWATYFCPFNFKDSFFASFISSTCFFFRSVRMARPSDIRELYTLKVDNISYRTVREDLDSLFGKFGDIGDIYIPKDGWVFTLRAFFMTKCNQKSLKLRLIVSKRWYFFTIFYFQWWNFLINIFPETFRKCCEPTMVQR